MSNASRISTREVTGSGVYFAAAPTMLRSTFPSYRQEFFFNELFRVAKWFWRIERFDHNGVDLGFQGLSPADYLWRFEDFYLMTGATGTAVTPTNPFEMNSIQYPMDWLNSLGLPNGMKFRMHESPAGPTLGFAVDYAVGDDFYIMIIDNNDLNPGQDNKLELIASGGAFQCLFNGNDITGYTVTYSI